MTKKLKFNIKKCLLVELYQFKQRGPLIMNHRVDCQFSTGALDYYKSPRLLNNNNNKWTFVMRQLQKCPVAQYRHNENVQ